MASLQRHIDGPGRSLAPPGVTRRTFFRGEPPVPRSADGYWIRVYRRAMACRFEVTLDEHDSRHIAAARRALDDIDRIDARLTVFRDSSLLTYVNRHASHQAVAIDDDLAALVALCQALNRDTEGAFDITTTPLSRCWGFLQRSGRLPAQEEIDRALTLVGLDGVELDSAACTVRFRRAGVELNLGSIGKGWALDAIARGLETAGVARALVSAGGSSVLAVGTSPDGWPIDITSARVSGATLARLSLHHGALGTSGAGEQFFDIEGTRYGHVLDPRTGWPASGVLSASVVADSAAVADALSTALLVAGPALAERYCAAHPGVLALVTPDDGSLTPRHFGRHDGVMVETT